MSSNDFKRLASLLLIILIFGAILRLSNLNRFPPSLYSDEVNQAYNAYSLLKIGQDEHGSFLPVALRSFGDWKPPLPSYLMLPGIFLFGLDEFAARVPSAILGLISIFLSYVLVRQLLPPITNRKVALLTAFFIAASPWHIHQSRSAMLVMVALVTMQAATVAFLLGLRKPPFLIISSIFFVFTFYSYYGMRLITPVWLLILCLFFIVKLQTIRRIVLISFLIGIIGMSPLVVAFTHEPNVIFGRAKTVSIFYDRGVELKLWEYASEDGSLPTSVTRFFHNKFYEYAKDSIKRFTSHLDGEFLFVRGDLASPFMIPGMGVLYLPDSLFLVFGVYLLLRRKRRYYRLVFLWLGVSIIPAALTFLTPAHNRSFNAVFPFLVIVSVGIVSFIRTKPKLAFWLSIFVVTIYTLNIGYYLRQYWVVIPQQHSDQWLFGLREVVSYVNTLPKDRNIVLLPKTNIGYIYFLFYNKYDPNAFVHTAVRDLTPDEFGFEHVRHFDHFTSLRQGTWQDALKLGHKVTIIGRAGEIPDKMIDRRILYPNGQIAFVIGNL